MIRDRILRADDSLAGMRLDLAVCRAIPSTSRALVTQAIEGGLVLLNGRRARKGDRVSAGDEVSIAELFETADWRAMPNPALRIPILREDASFLAADKPSGLPVHPLHPRDTDTVVSGLLAAYPELGGVGPDALFPAVVHRLDAETSGVLLAARTGNAYTNLRAQFAQRRVLKKYVALVHGSIRQPGRLEHHLVHSFGGTHRMRVADPSAAGTDKRPMRAVTEYSVLERLPHHTLLDITIRTGVTHQIRCQLAAADHPIVGDALYGTPDRDSDGPGRLFLHAAEIGFQHPETMESLVVRSEIPPELEACLRQIRQTA